MEIMEGVHLHLLLLLVTLIQGIQGQVVTPPSSVAVAIGDDVLLTCTTTAAPEFTFSWTDVSAGVLIYSAGAKQTTPQQYVNFDLDEDTTAKTSTLIINDIQDAGEYRCGVSGQAPQDSAIVTVEEGSSAQSIGLESIDDKSNSTYEATFEATGTSPEEIITWILDGVIQTDGIVETVQQRPDDSLFDKSSVFKFPATIANDNARLDCNISGHQVAKLNRQITRLVDIHDPPVLTGGIIIGFTSDVAGLTVTCDINNAVAPAVPAMSTFYIYSNGTLVTNPELDNTVIVTEPEYDTEFTCVGGNYLGNTTTTRTFEPRSTTTPTPTTTAAQEKTTPVVKDTTPGGPGTTNIGPIIGGVVGAIVVIVIIVIAVCYCKKEERFCFEAGGTKSSGSSKPAGSAVGSSNGSEREKTKPEAAPRGHGSIQHTNDNPNQDMYAMVDKKPSGGRGGDAPDRGSGPGQNEPQGMLYADLDLSHKAGHTDKHVPKNENDVVVYSSILV